MISLGPKVRLASGSSSLHKVCPFPVISDPPLIAMFFCLFICWFWFFFVDYRQWRGSPFSALE